jgi:hypothetical protein
MQDSPLGVLVVGQQRDTNAQHDFEKLVSMVSHGEVKGVVLDEQIAVNGDRTSIVRPHAVRTAAMRGAAVGFFLGLFPLIATVLITAGAGAVVAKASQLRLEGGSVQVPHIARR